MYQFGQFLGNGNETYLEDLTNYQTIVDFSTQMSDEEIFQGNNIVFVNKAMQPTSVSASFETSNYYYLKFRILKKTDAIFNDQNNQQINNQNNQQTFYLKLQKTNNDSSGAVQKEQYIKTFIVPNDNSQNEIDEDNLSNWVYFETIISPNSNYNQLLWEMKRQYIDFTTSERTGTNGRISKIVIQFFGRIDNKMPNLPNGINSLSKVGIQGPPAMLMCINGEEIRIGKSGVYEINDSVQINFLGFIPTTNDYFIVDYEYGEED